MRLTFTILLLTLFFIGKGQAPDPALCCADAPILCEFNLLNGYTASTPQSVNVCGPSSLCPTGGVPNNMSWWGFVAGSNSVSITVDASNCQGASGGGGTTFGIQVGIYSDCTFSNALACSPGCSGGGPDPAPITLSSNSFVPGQTYYVFVDGCAGDVCQYEVTVNFGGDPIMVPDPDLFSWPAINLLGDTICEGAEGVPFTTPLPPDVEPSYFWVLDGDTLGEVTNNAFIDFPVSGEFELCVTPYTDCDTSDAPQCSIIIVEPYQTRFDTTVLCEEDYPYDWLGLDIPQGGDYTQAFEDNYSCPYDLQMTFVELESYTDPNEIVQIDTAMCFGDSYTAIPGHVFIDEADEDIILQTVPHLGLSCDSIVHLNLAVINGVAEDAHVVCLDGAFEIFVPVPYIAPDDANFVLLVYDDFGALIASSDENSESVMVDQAGFYDIVLQVYYDDVYCEISTQSIILDFADFIPQELEIIGPDMPCSNDLSEYVLVVGNADYYFSDPGTCVLWTLPTGASDLSFPECDTILLVDWGASPGGTIEAYVSNLCGESEIVTIDVNLQVPPTPDAGQDDVICGDTYSLNATSPTMNGFWKQTSGPGTSIFTDIQNPQSDVSISTFGTYEYTWVEGSGNCIDSAQVEIIFGVPPMLDGAVSVDCNNATLEYTVSFDVTGGTTPYIIISGGGSFTGSTYTSPPSASGPYLIEITDQNNCDTITVQGTKDCLCVTNAGNMTDLTLIELCEDQEATATHDTGTEVNDGDDVGTYVLHTNSGAVMGTLIAQNGTGTFGFDSGTMAYEVEYYISFVYGSDDSSGNVNFGDNCLSVAQGTPVIWHKNPKPDAGNDDSTCGVDYALQATADAGNGTWTKTSGPGDAAFEFNNVPQTMVSVTEPGDYTFTWSEDNAGCLGSDEVVITFIENPVINNSSISFDCDDTNTSYTISFTITGGESSSYQVIGSSGTLNGSVFTSDPILSTGAYDFGVFDLNACDTFYISGDHLCDCDTEVGLMDLNKLTVCGDGPIDAIYDDSDEVLDSDDIVYYYLHSGSGNTLGTIYASGPNPSFSFQTGMDYGVSYYISAVAGNDNGNGEIDFADACRKVAPGTEVVFFEFPTAMIDAVTTTLTCEEPELDLDANLSSPVGGLIFNWTASNGGSIVDGSDEAIATVNGAGTYTLKVTTIDGLCEDETSINVDLQADVPVVDIAIPDNLTCVVNSVIIDASNSTSGSGIEYTWSTINGNIIAGQGTDKIEVDADGTYSLTIKDTNNGCEITGSTDVILDNTVPTAFAVSPDEITCDQTSVVIDGTGSSMGMEFTYSWSSADGNIVSGGNTLAPVVDADGMYTLTVENTINGCSETFEVEVVANGDVITDVEHSEAGPTCHGDTDGSISVQNIVGGTAPYTINFNGTDVGNQTQFDNLGAGSHNIVVTDINGCEFTVNIILADPEEVKIDALKSYILNKGDDLELVFNSISIPEDSIANIEVTSLKDSSVLNFTNLNISFTPTSSGQYQVVVTDVNGCFDTDIISVQLAVDHSVFFPNIFTPNNDGKNDRFSIFAGPEVVSVNTMMLFNRWGEKVYESRNFVPDSSIGWDGNFRGDKMQAGIYVYHAEILFTDGAIISYNGEVFLAR